MARPHIVLASAEVWPFVEGGGIGRHVRDVAAALAAAADVTILTDGRHRPRHDELVRAGDARLPAGVAFAWAEEPGEDLSPFESWFHATSSAFTAELARIAADRPVDLVELEDYRGLGAVAVQAATAGLAELEHTTMAVRMHTTWEMTAVLDRVAVDPDAYRWLMALERIALREADRLIAPAEATLRAYRRFYGAEALAPSASIIASPVPAPAATVPAPPPARDGLRMLYVGRLQEIKGVRSLVQAFRRLPDDDVELTLVGGDTETAPGGGSMRAHLELLAAGDPRIHFLPRVAPAELDAVFDAHHVVVVPSRFESFGYVAREALARHRPVVATAVGGMARMIEPGVNGWVVDGLGDDDLLAVLAEVAADRDAVDAMLASGGPAATLAAARDDDGLIAGYLELAAGAPPASRAIAPDRRGTGEPATAIVDATGGGDLAATLDSIEALAGEPAPEIAVIARTMDHVDAASMRRAHHVELAPPGTSLNAARSRVLAARRATGPVLLLGAGTTLDPAFGERARRALAAASHPGYATAYGTGRSVRNVPVGNRAAQLVGDPWTSASAALVAADALPLPLPEPTARGADDPALFDALRLAGRHGAILPERLVGRVRPPASRPPRGTRGPIVLPAGADLLAETGAGR